MTAALAAFVTAWRANAEQIPTAYGIPAALLTFGAVLWLWNQFYARRLNRAFDALRAERETAAARIRLPDPVAPAPPPPAMDASRVYIDSTPKKLCSLYGSHVGLQASRLTEVYIGRWLVVSGPFGDALPEGQPYFVQVTFLANREQPTIFMYFRDPARWDDLAVIERGTTITVHGKIDRIESSALHLTDCEIRNSA
jgi:hypothetical protein